MTTILGKREFLHHASQYLKEVEANGIELIITNHGAETIKIIPAKQKAIDDLRGIIPHVHADGDINDPVLPGFDKW